MIQLVLPYHLTVDLELERRTAAEVADMANASGDVKWNWRRMRSGTHFS
jgi:hypothetical protein